MEKVKNLLVFSINMKDLPNGVALVWGGPFGETTWATRPLSAVTSNCPESKYYKALDMAQ